MASLSEQVNEASEESQGALRSFFAFLNSAGFLTKFHATATIVWILLIIPSFLLWKESLLWVITMSLWANVASHWAAYQGSRSERRIEKQEKDK